MGSNMANAPSATWYIVDVLRHNDIYTVQVAYQFTSASCPVYIRTQTNGIWNAWRLFNPGTANTAQVLTGYTFSSANGVNLSGSMVNRGAVSQTINPGGSYTIPAGYHNGSGRVIASKLGTAWQSISLVSQECGGSNNSFQYTSNATGYYLFIVSMRDEYENSFPVTGNFTTNGTTIYNYTYNGGEQVYNYASVIYVYLVSGQYVRWNESATYDYRSTGYQVFRIS